MIFRFQPVFENLKTALSLEHHISENSQRYVSSEINHVVEITVVLLSSMDKQLNINHQLSYL